jgi:dTDP-3,4-didehydro-2,6-dideoxy-alpha-D-glucose 3-reductase
MKALLLGYSSIARRRVLPALAAIGVRHIDVASRTRAGNLALPEGLSGHVFGEYADALRNSEAELVYVSTINSLHAELAAAALEGGRHVVIDKPAATNLEDVRLLVHLARERARLLAEATVYGYHPQIAAARGVFEEAGIRPTRLVAAFSFPPMPPENFRQSAELGGGAMLDLGPYAVSVGRLFFREPPLEIVARGSYSAFSLLATYSGDRSLAGHFGMTTGYINRLDALGPDTTVTIDRVFTTTSDMICNIGINRRNQHRTISVPPADSFAIFLSAVFQAINSGEMLPFAEVMLADAEALDRLRAND